MKKKVLAIVAHPDDIEFVMSGTLMLLAKAGCEIHYMNVANGYCGTAEHDAKTIIDIRLQEAKNAAQLIGATFYPPIAPDLGVFYNEELLAKLSSVIRKAAPDILLIPSPQDYMEDHTNTCRLAVTAAFTRGMPNYKTNPPRAVIDNEIAVYHAQPHGNRDGMNQLITPDIFINISEVMEEKRNMLAEHKSQKEWLDRSQGFNAYLDIMKEHGREVGSMSKQCEFAEGWRQHNPLGLCATNSDPMKELLQEYYFRRN
ncbi:MAG: PIG-L family deacetylase [Flavobacteriaceae bacterium]|nr:PIG-L family deacetylase [Flavobacteriaceae bacterium]